MAQQSLEFHGILIIEASRSHSRQAILGRTPDVETITWQHTIPRNRHPCPMRDSNPRSQRAKDCRTTHQTVSPLVSAVESLVSETLSASKPKNVVRILYIWVRASWIEFNNCPTRCDLLSLLHFCRQLYMFQVLTPIIRSSYSCNYSFWYWSIGSTTIRSRCWVGTTTRADGSRCGLSIPEAVITAVRAPDDGCQNPKHVELPTEM